MESSVLSIFVFMLLLLLFTIAKSHSFNTTMLSKCHEKERYALLEFKATFYNVSCYHAPDDGGANLETWTVEGRNKDCCTWDGIECDEHNGYVIGLHLRSSCLSGSINSSSSIFELVHLQRLDLSANDFQYSEIPPTVSNLSRLISLELSYSNFSGQIPFEILHLTNLSLLDLSGNQLSLLNPSLGDLVQALVKLDKLHLDQVNLSSSILDSISRLSSLKSLSLCGCGLQGHIPSSIANLVSLESLNLTGNCLKGQILCLKNLTNLTILRLAKNNLVGDITSFFHNLTQLHVVNLQFNNLTGEILPQLLRSTELKFVVISYNKFYGQIPTTISSLKNLSCFYLYSNNFSGKIYVDVLLKLENLQLLDLSFNNFSLIIEPTIQSRQKLILLGLAACNLTGFPKFLRDQDKLEYIDLSSNNISSEVPEWFLDVNTKGLSYLNLSYNHLTGFGGNLPHLRWKQLNTLDLSFNLLKGSLPSLSTNTSPVFYLVSNNGFSGEMPTWMCNLVNLKILNMDNNNLSGKIPPCFSDLVDASNLSLLSLRSNNFKGRIPQLGKNRCNLVMIDMSYNQLEGQVPMDIKNCMKLEFLNLGNNKISDVFRYWLGKLPSLSVLVLESNRFHGVIEKPKGDYHFPKLRIIRASRNKFMGRLPSQYFTSWSAMKVDATKEGQQQYFGLNTRVDLVITTGKYNPKMMIGIVIDYYYSFTMYNKGTKTEYNMIQDSLKVIDLSNNNFTGEIPESIGVLRGLYLLDLSNNLLTGWIPFTLNGLINLESLDLSHNELSCEIPQSLTDLTMLSFFDVSFNRLTGPIPLSKQFSTFDNSSYEGNLGLCGQPVLRECRNVETLPSSSLEEDHMSRTSLEIDWRIVSMGYASGFIIGVSIGMTWTRGYKRVKKIHQIRFV